MKILQTKRLILRPFAESDFTAVHSYADRVENLTYMTWGPNSEDETRAYIKRVMHLDFYFAVTLRESGQLIGACEIHPDCGVLGWILHRDYWNQGYGTETAGELLRFGFDDLGLHRIMAHCDAENTGSYKIMEKIGMRREGCFHDTRPANKLSDRKYGDEYQYAILRDEWETKKEIAYYNSLPVTFNGFISVPELTDGVIRLFCYKKYPANPEKKHVPAYHFAICKDGEQIGEINLRIGYTDGLYYGGQIGYGIDEPYRGSGYAGDACRLLIPVAKAHDMKILLITNNQGNRASKRVCEKLGARFIRTARLPEWTELYQEGNRWENIFEWSII
jgi:RimJ/RimL family protein N-acetyltransferase